MELWVGAIRQHLGKKAVRYVECLTVNILAVDKGVKPSYLYDVAEPCGDKLKGLLKELRERSLITTNLNVLEIGMDCLVVNTEAVKNESVLQDLDQRLINVSKFIKKPALCCNSDGVNSLKEAYTSIVTDLDSDKVHFVSLPCSVSCNISSLFGVLLNYPVIYWYKTDDGQGENCLSMEKLVCVKVTADLNLKYLKTESSVCLKESCLFSFSYPSCLNVQCEPLIDNWFKRIQEKVSDSKIFLNVQRHREERVLQAVVL